MFDRRRKERDSGWWQEGHEKWEEECQEEKEEKSLWFGFLKRDVKESFFFLPIFRVFILSFFLLNIFQVFG